MNHHPNKRSLSALEIMPYAVMTGIVDMAPVPVVMEYLKGYFRTALLKKITRAHHLKLEKGIISVLTLGELAHGFRGAVTSVIRFLTTPWQYVKHYYAFTGLAEETARTYAMAFLFERYLVVRGTKGLDPDEAGKLREAMDHAFFKTAQLAVSPLFLALRQFHPAPLVQLIHSSIGMILPWARRHKHPDGLIGRIERQSSTLVLLSAAFSVALKMKGGLFQKSLERDFFSALEPEKTTKRLALVAGGRS